MHSHLYTRWYIGGWAKKWLKMLCDLSLWSPVVHIYVLRYISFVKMFSYFFVLLFIACQSLGYRTAWKRGLSLSFSIWCRKQTILMFKFSLRFMYACIIVNLMCLLLVYYFVVFSCSRYDRHIIMLMVHECISHLSSLLIDVKVIFFKEKAIFISF